MCFVGGFLHITETTPTKFLEKKSARVFISLFILFYMFIYGIGELCFQTVF